MREEKTRKPGCNVATRQGNLSCCISKWMIMTSRVEEGAVETVGSPCKQLQLPPPQAAADLSVHALVLRFP